MRLRYCLLSLAAVLAVSATAVRAESFVSSASSAGSESSGSVSDSIGASSNSSKDDRKVGQGRYRVVDVAEAKDKPGTMQVALQADDGVSPDAMQSFNLFVPAKTLEKQPLAKGALVQVNERPYGLEFAMHQTKQPFYLVLADGWQQQMKSKVVAI